jgi:hypothetical protein
MASVPDVDYRSLNQQRLETYLSSYGQPNFDLTDRLQDASDDYEQV